jgi:hypothetical protein
MPPQRRRADYPRLGILPAGAITGRGRSQSRRWTAGRRDGPGEESACTPSRTPSPRRSRQPCRTPARVLDHRLPAAFSPPASYPRADGFEPAGCPGASVRQKPKYRPSCSRQQEATLRSRPRRQALSAGSGPDDVRRHGQPAPTLPPTASGQCPATARQRPQPPARPPPAREFHARRPFPRKRKHFR